MLSISIKIRTINILFLFLPVSYIAGNLLINLNILLLILSGLFFFGKDLLKIDFTLVDKLIFFLFIFFLTISFYNYFKPAEISSFDLKFILSKTIFYFRYLLFYLVLRYFIEKEIISLKFFFILCLACCLFVSFDIFYQLIFGNDIFGYEGVSRKLSGPFGDEWIAGAYLQKFAPIGLFAVPLIVDLSKKNKLIFLLSIMFLIILSAIVLSGNRMPLVLFLFVICLIFIFEKKLRKYLIQLIFLSSVMIFFIYNSSLEIKTNIDSFITYSKKLSTVITDEKINRLEMPSHYAEFESFYDTWQMNKYIGGGIRSFRVNCPNRGNIDPDERSTCNTHPHNYYLEILTDLGLVGLALILSIFLIIFYKSFIAKYFLINKNTLKTNYFITPFLFLFIAEIFPIKSTGSFFTTFNSAYIFLIMAVIVSLIKQKNYE